MIHVDALDFSEWHSKEVISFFWHSVYLCNLNYVIFVLFITFLWIYMNYNHVNSTTEEKEMFFRMICFDSMYNGALVKQ